MLFPTIRLHTQVLFLIYFTLKCCFLYTSHSNAVSYILHTQVLFPIYFTLKCCFLYTSHSIALSSCHLLRTLVSRNTDRGIILYYTLSIGWFISAVNKLHSSVQIWSPFSSQHQGKSNSLSKSLQWSDWNLVSLIANRRSELFFPWTRLIDMKMIIIMYIIQFSI